MNWRTRSAPMRLSAMSVAVLSLCAIIASSTVRALTWPERYGGLNIGAPGEYTSSSRASGSSSDVAPASTWRRNSASTRALKALPQKSGASACSATDHSAMPSTAGAQIFSAFSPGKRSKAATICSASRPGADRSARVGGGSAPTAAVASAAERKARRDCLMVRSSLSLTSNAAAVSRRPCRSGDSRSRSKRSVPSRGVVMISCSPGEWRSCSPCYLSARDRVASSRVAHCDRGYLPKNAGGSQGGLKHDPARSLDTGLHSSIQSKFSGKHAGCSRRSVPSATNVGGRVTANPKQPPAGQSTSLTAQWLQILGSSF